MRAVLLSGLLPAIVLGGCGSAASAPDAAGAALEQAAIAAGVVRDPADTDITGLYARETDRVCIVPARSGYRIGATIDYGEGQTCNARGTVARSGDVLRIAFEGADGCDFDARMDGDVIAFPGRVPDSCAALCGDRASFAALEAELQSEVVAEASTLRGTRGQALCGS